MKGIFKPFYTLLMLVVVMALLSIISSLFPAEGVPILGYKFRFPSLASTFSMEQEKKTDISQIVALADSLEEMSTATDTLIKDSLLKNSIVPVPILIGDTNIKLITTIQYANNNRNALHSFFQSLVNLQADNTSMRVLHYGDSQIEGDRISDYIRMKLQGQFGGSGPGFLQVMPVAQTVAFRQSWSENWDRYNAFAGRDKRAKNSNFGIAAGYSRFMPHANLNDSSQVDEAWFKISTNKNGGARLASYSHVKLFYGAAQSKTFCQFIENTALKETDSLEIGGTFRVKKFSLSQAPSSFEIRLKGKDSPDVYGVSLEGNGGVMVDNFGLRGSSGTFFKQINNEQLRTFYDYLNVKMVILQFGGNSLPYVTDKQKADDFGLYLRAQINAIRKMIPGVSILVIGPADMSVKEGDVYKTHPQLENLRDAIRKAAFDSGSAFFDMYDCMGGYNSMLSWVDQGIAAHDYIHFSPGGARKVAMLLYSAMISDYNDFVRNYKGEAK